MQDTLVICGHRYTFWISARKATLNRREQRQDGSWTQGADIAVFRHSDAKTILEMTRQSDGTAIGLDFIGDEILARIVKA